jgi:methylated-DNA-[protein]-cysteine S-methyltransferase
MNSFQWLMKSEIGPLYFVASDSGLRGLYFDKQESPMPRTLQGPAPAIRILARAVRQMEQYLGGRRKAFDLPLEAEGTEFQKKVWKELSKIPYGRTCSYRDIARRIKQEKAVRAVGTANGRNPLCIIVPCHRVIASDGSLGGYTAGLEIKSKLLELEKRA